MIDGTRVRIGDEINGKAVTIGESIDMMKANVASAVTLRTSRPEFFSTYAFIQPMAAEDVAAAVVKQRARSSSIPSESILAESDAGVTHPPADFFVSSNVTASL